MTSGTEQAWAEFADLYRRYRRSLPVAFVGGAVGMIVFAVGGSLFQHLFGWWGAAPVMAVGATVVVVTVGYHSWLSFWLRFFPCPNCGAWWYAFQPSWAIFLTDRCKWCGASPRSPNGSKRGAS